MSKPIERVEIITGRERHWRCTAEEKVRLVEEAMQLGMRIPTKPATDSDRSQPPVPKQTSRAFR